MLTYVSVSYTHLDVYKRQVYVCVCVCVCVCVLARVRVKCLSEVFKTASERESAR